MALKDVQIQVDEWTSRFTPQYWRPHEILARLAEEVGELAREINHVYGPKKKKPDECAGNLGEEISDIVFTLCCLANSLEIDLDEAFQKMMGKYRQRDRDRYEKRTE